MTKPYNVYSVDEISNKVKRIIRKNFKNIWVRGEISNFKHHNGRHMYFSLKDKNSVIQCTMFKRANKKLKFKPKEGQKVLVRGEIDVYKKKGEYRIIVEEMKISGKGELYEKYLALKKKLRKEGLFKKRREIPKFPKKIGVVTSSEGSAVRDIIKTINKRFPCNIIIYPSHVQGENAKENISRGIKKLDGKVEVIIVARGGGSIEDLWPFNEEIVARAIFNSKTPIVSGVGHETDNTITDFVADKRGTTPAGAAEIVTPVKKEEVSRKIRELRERITRGIHRNMEDYNRKLEYLLKNTVFKKPLLLIDEYKEEMDDNEEKLERLIKDKIKNMKEKLNIEDGKLNALNPYSVINRGYSMTLINNKIVESVNNLKEGDKIKTVLKDGKVKSKIDKIEEE